MYLPQMLPERQHQEAGPAEGSLEMALHYIL